MSIICQCLYPLGINVGYVTVKYGIFICFSSHMIYLGFHWENIMKNAEFMKLVTALRGLDHHQRKRLGAALAQSSDEANVLDLIEGCFEGKSACPHCGQCRAVPEWQC